MRQMLPVTSEETYMNPPNLIWFECITVVNVRGHNSVSSVRERLSSDSGPEKAQANNANFNGIHPVVR
jgi:hypothetical protein